MADAVTPAQIIAADVALRYGVPVCPSVVQLCPPCTFATTTPVWDGKDLVYPDAEARRAQQKKAMWAGAVKACRDHPEVTARREAVRGLHATGASVRAIMAALQVKYHIVIKDLRDLSLSPNDYVTDAMTQARVRAERIQQLHGEGWAVADIAAHLGVVPDTVRDLAWKHHGIRFARKAAKLRVKAEHRCAVSMPRISASAARQEVLRGLMAAGGPVANWAAHCGVSPHTIRGDMSRMGLPWGTARGMVTRKGTHADHQTQRRAARDARRAEVLRLHHQGLMPNAIAQRLGCTSRTVAVDKLALGLTGQIICAALERRAA